MVLLVDVAVLPVTLRSPLLGGDTLGPGTLAMPLLLLLRFVEGEVPCLQNQIVLYLRVSLQIYHDWQRIQIIRVADLRRLQ